MILTYEFNEEEFDYEVDFKELQKALVEILCDHVKCLHKTLYNKDGAYQMAMYIVHELDLTDELQEQLKDKLYEYFYDDAYDAYKDCIAYEKELDSWFGTKNDVLGL